MNSDSDKPKNQKPSQEQENKEKRKRIFPPGIGNFKDTGKRFPPPPFSKSPRRQVPPAGYRNTSAQTRKKVPMDFEEFRRQKIAEQQRAQLKEKLQSERPSEGYTISRERFELSDKIEAQGEKYQERAHLRDDILPGAQVDRERYHRSSQITSGGDHYQDHRLGNFRHKKNKQADPPPKFYTKDRFGEEEK